VSKVDDCYLGPSTACIVAAATDRGIPHIRLNDGNLVQLGHGANQRRIWTAETDYTSAIAEGIARDKDLTKSLLASLRRAGARGQRGVDSAEEAWEAAEDIGLPVVVKPSDGNHGRGVSLDLRRAKTSKAAFAVAERARQRSAGRALHPRQRAPPAGGGRQGGGRRARRDRSPWSPATASSPWRAGRLADQHDPRRGATKTRRSAWSSRPPTKPCCSNCSARAWTRRRAGRRSPGADPAQRQRVHRLHRPVHPDVAHVVSLAARVVGPRHRRRRPGGRRHLQAAAPAERGASSKSTPARAC
jgi:cyanophycin synthetase